ncbi:MAG: transglycosylase SLT domain-containing protein [Gammaproteobacteria bacterium]
MQTTRRSFIQQCSSGFLLSAVSSAALGQQESCPSLDKPINIILPKDYSFASMVKKDPNYEYRLKNAVLKVIADHYRGKILPVWGKNYEEVELDKRISNITYWVLRSVREYESIYSIDPAWLLAQIMAESFFYEFAVSPALAVGICQITQPTAEDYGLLCAGSHDEHARPPYKLWELADTGRLYYKLRQERRQFYRKKPAHLLSLEDALAELVADERSADSAVVTEQLQYMRDLKELDQQRYEARDAFRSYLKANSQDRDIFDDADAAFLLRFDQRFTYRAPIAVMTKIMARALGARHGNILAATAGYNAGLGNTRASGLYAPYGRIPEFGETITYISKVLINYQEIGRQL